MLKGGSRGDLEDENTVAVDRVYRVYCLFEWRERYKRNSSIHLFQVCLENRRIRKSYSNRFIFNRWFLAIQEKLETSIDLDIFFHPSKNVCFMEKFQFEWRVSKSCEFDDRSMTASIRFVSRLFRDSRYPFNCISANRSTLDESICQRVSVQTTRIGLAISAHPIGISRADKPRSSSFRQRRKDSWRKVEYRTRFLFSEISMLNVSLIIKIIFQIRKNFMEPHNSEEINKCHLKLRLRIVSTYGKRFIAANLFLEITFQVRSRILVSTIKNWI